MLKSTTEFTISWEFLRLSNYNEINKLLDSFYRPKEEMDVYNIFLKHHSPDELPSEQARSFYLSKFIEEKSLQFVQQKLGYVHISQSQYIESIDFTQSINSIVEKYNSNITKSGIYGWTLPYSQQYSLLNLPKMPNQNVVYNIIETKSVNEFYKYHLNNLVNFNISNFFEDSLYKPTQITYNKCVVRSCYIDVSNSGSVYFDYNNRPNNSAIMICAYPYFNNQLDSTRPFMFFNKQGYKFSSQNVVFGIDWKVVGDLSLPYTQGVFVLQYGVKQSWIVYVTQSNSYNNFSITISKSIVEKYLDQKENIDLSIGFIFTGSSIHPPKPMCFCNAKIEKI